MKIYLDDERPVPEGWVGAKTPTEVIDLLATGEVTDLSLDHDLGVKATGYDVILWIEREVFLSGFTPPSIYVHSANSSTKLKMLAGIDQIQAFHLNRECQK